MNKEDKNKVYNSTRWRKLRIQILNISPICYICKKNPSNEVDHIKTFKDIKDVNAWDSTNLKGICSSCHREMSWYENTIQSKLFNIGGGYKEKRIIYLSMRRPTFDEDGYIIKVI